MRRALSAVAAGTLRLDGLLTHCCRLEDLAEGFSALESRPDGFLKAWVQP
jgi:threonine dehydrogenase-like Zn-dependent dehydrogenase